MPNFFNSTKFFSCLDLKESQELFETTQMVRRTSSLHESASPAGESQNQGLTCHQQDIVRQSTAYETSDECSQSLWAAAAGNSNVHTSTQVQMAAPTLR